MTKCFKCGADNAQFNQIGSTRKVCTKCHRKFSDSNDKRKERLIGNLDKCFDYEKRKIKTIKITKFVNKEDLVLKKKIWEENFAEDFPCYKSYVSILSSWRVSGTDLDSVRKSIDRINGLLKTKEGISIEEFLKQSE